MRKSVCIIECEKQTELSRIPRRYLVGVDVSNMKKKRKIQKHGVVTVERKKTAYFRLIELMKGDLIDV